MGPFKQERRIDALAALVLFGVFAACILTVLLTGVKVYRGLVIRDQGSYQQRTFVQYLSTRVRQAPSPAAISTGPFGPVEALSISETVEDEVYLTRIYCYENTIRELYSHRDTQLHPQDGQVILPARNLSFSLSHDLLTISLTQEDGCLSTLYLDLTQQEGLP